MKRLAIGLILMLMVTPCFASDIVKAEVREDVVKWELDTVRFLVITKTCEVTYRKVDADGISVNEEIKVIFQNVADDPETEEDETNTEFTQLVNFINAGDNIKNSITNAVKIKLGL